MLSLRIWRCMERELSLIFDWTIPRSFRSPHEIVSDIYVRLPRMTESLESYRRCTSISWRFLRPCHSRESILSKQALSAAAFCSQAKRDATTVTLSHFG